jgi:hypothetical protein
MDKAQDTGTDLCYLCGDALADPVNVDHVPPRLFYPESVRKAVNLSRLLTIKVHKSCNATCRLDEEYFVHTLMPFARGSLTGSVIYQQILDRYRRGKNVPLVRKVLREVDPLPGGLVLPRGKVVKWADGARLQRIAWKLVSLLPAKCCHFPHQKSHQIICGTIMVSVIRNPAAAAARPAFVR